MNKKELQAFAQAAAKNIKSQEDLNQFQQMLTKVTEKLGIEVSAEQLFEMPSIAVLGAYIDDKLRGEVEDDEVAALLAEIEGLSDEETLALLEPDE